MALFWVFSTLSCAHGKLEATARCPHRTELASIISCLTLIKLLNTEGGLQSGLQMACNYGAA